VINFVGAGTIVPNIGLQLTNVTINTGAVVMGGGNTTINGTFEIKGGNVSPGTAPTYASSPASTLSYNCSCNYGAYEEWYPNTFGTSAGVPHNVNIAAGSSLNFGSGTFPHEMRGNLTISATSTFALSTGIGGDLYIKGNWTKAAGGIFTNNARAVKFNGTGSNQTITVTGGGTETFGYFQVNKGAGETVILAAAPNATNVTINGGLGGNPLELQSGDLDLNGRTVNFANYFNSNQNNIGIDGTPGNLTRNVISSSGAGVFTVFNNVAGTHNITIGRLSANASLLSFGATVTLTTSGIAAGAGGINFGNTLTTINGTLQINNFGFVTGFAPTYAVNSNLVYNSTGLFDRNVEWGNTSGPGYPYNVTAQNTTNLRLNFPNLNGNANRAIAGTLTIANGSTVLLSTTDPSTLTIGKDLIINGTLTMPTVAGGDVYVGRNWNRSATGVFTDNDRAVFFNGSDNGTITANGGQYFPYIYLEKTALANTVSLVDDISVGKEFSVTSGTFQLANRNATLLSTATNTASFGKVGASGDVAYSGTGRFIVERYLPTGTLGGQHTKSWQFLAVPTNGGQTINAAWQEGAAVANADPVSGYGTQITSNVAPLQPMFDALDHSCFRTFYEDLQSGWCRFMGRCSQHDFNCFI
jgi:hypothetical protein